ncbi:hypothetical protein JCM18882A_34080 [Brevibacterium metallidurans]|uniref:Uncharacterized protein n=1 Tax=Brevibacterium metallidurans TaxID=1482676 RepID=A0ABN0SSS8_9MICO
MTDQQPSGTSSLNNRARCPPPSVAFGAAALGHGTARLSPQDLQMWRGRFAAIRADDDKQILN